MGTPSFNQILVGSNGTGDPMTTAATNGAYGVGPNYNLVTGLGSPNIGNLVAALTVSPSVASSAPVFVSQPQMQIVSQGSPATFTAMATGTPTPTYQWVFSDYSTIFGSLHNNALSGLSLTDGLPIDGNTFKGSQTNTLTIANAQNAGNLTQSVQVIATNSAGVAVSEAAPFLVAPPNTNPQIVVGPTSQTVTAGDSVTLTAIPYGSPPVYCQWYLNNNQIPGATGTSFTLKSVTAADAGGYSCWVMNSLGVYNSLPAALTVTPAGTSSTPKIISQPISHTMLAGSPLVLTVGATSGEALSYQWYMNGLAIPDATFSMYVINAVTPGNNGAYSCAVSSAGNRITSAAANISVITSTNPGRLTNISARALVKTGGNILIAGFNVGGAGTSGSEPVLIRGVGPTLGSNFSVQGSLADPSLQLFQEPAGTVLTKNTGWAGDPLIASATASVGTFPYPAGSVDAAISQTLAPGSYTAQVSGSSGDTGVALAEVYDASPAGSYNPSQPRLTNISARAFVATGSNVLIAGFVIGGSTSRTVLIRASGPVLATSFNVADVLPDPLLQLFSEPSGTLVASNAGWNGQSTVATFTTVEIASLAASVGAFVWNDTASNDSAILMTLPPGAYTAQVSGVSGDPGVALVEVYDIATYTVP